MRTAREQAANETRTTHRHSSFALNLHFTPPQADALPVATTGTSRSWDAAAQRYRVFTRAYDREADARTLVRAAQLAEFRAQMDQEVAESGINIPRLARMLHHALAVPRRTAYPARLLRRLPDGHRHASVQ